MRPTKPIIPSTATLDWRESPGIGYDAIACVRVGGVGTEACVGFCRLRSDGWWRWRVKASDYGGQSETLADAKVAVEAALTERAADLTAAA